MQFSKIVDGKKSVFFFFLIIILYLEYSDGNIHSGIPIAKLSVIKVFKRGH